MLPTNFTASVRQSISSISMNEIDTEEKHET